MDVPYWGQYMMLIASAVGTYLLFIGLSKAHWPAPFGGK